MNYNVYVIVEEELKKCSFKIRHLLYLVTHFLGKKPTSEKHQICLLSLFYTNV